MAFGIDTTKLSGQIAGQASNIYIGSNPDYDIYTFLAAYPQFASSSNIQTVSVHTGGSGYAVDNILTIVQPEASAGTAVVTRVTTVGETAGVVTNVALLTSGTRYYSATSLNTTVLPSGGAGCRLAITASIAKVPEDILNLFIAMANSSLQKSRWLSKWEYAMGLYIAHFCLLHLQTQVGANASSAQIIASAHSLFPKASKSVGDVSVSYDTSSILGELPGWAAWKTTSFGVQLATLARMFGAGGMYVW